MENNGVAFTGGVDPTEQQDVTDAAIADTMRMNEDYWRLAGTEGWKKLRVVLTDKVVETRSEMDTVDTLDALRFLQAKVQCYNEIINLVESSAEMLEALKRAPDSPE